MIQARGESPRAEVVSATLPEAVPLNTMYPTDKRTGRRYLSPRGKQFKKDAGTILSIAMRGKKPFSGPVSVRMTIYRPRRVGDLDGYVKCVLDACTGVVWDDDKQVVEIIARRDDDKANPRVSLVVAAAGVG